MSLRLMVAIVAGVLACGLPLWPVPYSSVSMPGNPSASTWLVLGALAGMLAGYVLKPLVWRPVMAVTGGFVLAVLGRVVVETARDPTSHNLWPFEIVIAGAIGFVAALCGVMIARLLLRAGAERSP